MKSIVTLFAVFLMMLVATGCNWKNVGRGLLLLGGSTTVLGSGTVYLDSDDNGSCDNWYDFADPGCW